MENQSPDREFFFSLPANRFLNLGNFSYSFPFWQDQILGNKSYFFLAVQTRKFDNESNLFIILVKNRFWAELEFLRIWDGLRVHSQSSMIGNHDHGFKSSISFIPSHSKSRTSH